MRFQSGTLTIEMNRLPRFADEKQFIDGKIIDENGNIRFRTNNDLLVPLDWSDERVAEDIVLWANDLAGEFDYSIYDAAEPGDCRVETRFVVHAIKEG